MAAKLDRRDPATPEYATVRAVNEDGTVTVEMGRGEVNSIPAARSYRSRAEGDVVVVAYARQGPFVLCAIGRSDEIVVDDNPPPSGQGWEQVNVYTRAGALWGDRVVASTPVGTVNVSATGLHVYRAGAWLRSGYAEQGDYGGQWGNQTGLFTFPAGAFAALSGKTPSAGAVTMHRRDTDHGSAAETLVTLWRGSVAGVPNVTPTRQAVSHPGGLLRRNQEATTPITASWLAPFCAGTANALLIYSDNTSENVEVDSLTLTITAA